MNIVEEIPLRARFEHCGSTVKNRMTYVTLAYVAMADELMVQYYAEYDDTTVWLRKAEEFAGVHKSGRKRFALLNENAISVDMRDEILTEDRIEKVA